MRRSSVFAAVLALTWLVPVTFAAAPAAQCSDMQSTYQRWCQRIEDKLTAANGAKDMVQITQLNAQRIQILKRWDRLVRNTEKRAAQVQADIGRSSITVLGSDSHPVCDGSLAIAGYTLSHRTCGFAK